MWTVTEYGDRFAVVNSGMQLIASFNSKGEALAFIAEYNPAN